MFAIRPEVGNSDMTVCRVRVDEITNDMVDLSTRIRLLKHGHSQTRCVLVYNRVIIRVIQPIIECSPAGVFGVVKEEATNSPLLEKCSGKMLQKPNKRRMR